MLGVKTVGFQRRLYYQNKLLVINVTLPEGRSSVLKN
jgi:hypothetical protein